MRIFTEQLSDAVAIPVFAGVVMALQDIVVLGGQLIVGAVISI
jgi:hypothetical protein